MSDQSISIVPKISDYPNSESKAEEILQWLVSKNIVNPLPSDCILDTDNGYSVAEGAESITDSPELIPYDLRTNGLHIITERTVFDTGENGIDEIICPNCLKDIVSEDWDLSPWSSGETDTLICPLCEQKSEIHKFSFTPEWGFSNLGFTFWNWPDFTDKFLHEFKQKLGCEINIVDQHI